MSILGSRVLRKEDTDFLTRGGIYTADLTDPLLEGAAHVAFVRSTMAHGRVLSVETEDAAEMPGVLGVYTASDIERIGGLAPFPIFPPVFDEAFRRPWLATDKVRFVGEPVALVVAEDPPSAVDAAELVWADLEPLAPVLDPLTSLGDETLLFPDHLTNVVIEYGDESEFDDSAFDDCDLVVRQRIHHPPLAACPLEVRSAAAVWQNERLILWLSTQGAHTARSVLTKSYELERSGVRVIAPDVGGGFGPKIHPYPEEMILGWVARQVERPVRWTETRTENMLAMGHGRGHVHDLTVGGTSEGDVQALRLDIVAEAGAYASLGADLPSFTRKMASGNYDIPTVQTRARAVVTNAVPTEAYRGAGRPEATASIERAMDLLAAEAGLDPVDVRRRNLIPADAFPHKTAAGATYDVGDYERSLDLVLGAVDMAGLRAEQDRRRAVGEIVQLGIGVSLYVEITAGPTAGNEFAEVQVHPDGSATVLTGSSPHGQGHHTAWAMIAADRLGIPMEQIDVVHGDTDLVRRGAGTQGSRSLQLGGSAVRVASECLVDHARALAADVLEVGVDDVVLDTTSASFHPAGSPAEALSWCEVVALDDGDGPLVQRHTFEADAPTYPFGAHVAVVEVDTETGHVKLVRFVACDDAGTIINPLLAEGQRHGGIAQGVAQALLEEFRYDADGNPVTANFADYAVISAAELPSFELVRSETPTPNNPLGAKGVGESGTIGATPAVVSAVVDALSHLGIRHIDMPTTPERVWSVIAAADAADAANAATAASDVEEYR